MQVRPDALVAMMARRPLPVVWIHGDEPLLQIEAADVARAAFRGQGYSERQVFDIDKGFKADDLAAEAGALSLFASRKLIELRMATKPLKEMGVMLARLAPTLADDVRLLISSPRLDRAATDAGWFADLDPLALVVPVYPVDAGQLPRWIGERLAAQRQRADAATLAMIAERVEGNLLAAHQEVSKLGLLFPEGDLPPDDVRAAVLNVARYDSFDLADAMLAGDAARALRSLDGLRAEGLAEPLVLWAVTEATRTLLRLAQASLDGRPVQQAMREARVYPPRDRLFERALRTAPADQLRRRLLHALQLAADTDRMIKGVDRGDPWKALERLVMTVAGAPVPAALTD